MIRIGLIGCGFMGKMHSECYKIIPGVEVVAVADLRRDYAEAIVGNSGAQIYSSAKELIENASVDAIDICLPTYLHAQYALMAMDKVKYLMVEKPLALTVDEGKALLEKAKATGCRVQVGQCLRFSKIYSPLKDLVKSERYGKPVFGNLYRISPRPDWAWDNWLFDIKRSGGAAQDLHVHDVDYMLHLFGRPEKTVVHKNSIGEENSSIVTSMQYKDFCITVEGGWDMPATFPFSEGYRVRFERGAIEYKNGVITEYDEETAKVVELESSVGTVEGGNVSDLGEYFYELTYFTDRIKANEEIEEASLELGFNTLDYLLGVIN